MMITSTMVTSGVLISFPMIWYGDLVFDSKSPSFKLDLGIKTSILSKIHDACFKNV